MIKKLCGAILAIIMTTSVAPASYHYGYYKTGITGTGWQYVDWDKVSWWDKQVIGITYANCKRKIASAEKKLEYHRLHSGSLEEAEAEIKLEQTRKYCSQNGRPYDGDFWNDLADMFPVLVVLFVVGLGFLLYPTVKKICNPKLWKQAKNTVK